MTVNELRIGNLIKQPTLGGTLTVDWMIIEIISKLGDFYDSEPIPLTEEWLLKFGFENRIRDNTYKLKNFGKFIFDREMGWLSFYPAGLMCGMRCDFIKHVHQLQNLYFALTGTELEIKQ